MKKTIQFTIFLLMYISVTSIAQERQNEERQKLRVSMDAQSEILSSITGWSKIENKDGRFWQKYNPKNEISQLPAYSADFAGFLSIQTYKFTIEGEHFCVLLKKINKESAKYYVFTQKEYDNFDAIVDWVEGIQWPETDMVEVKYSGYTDANFNPEEIILKNKDLIRALLLNTNRDTHPLFTCLLYTSDAADE